MNMAIFREKNKEYDGNSGRQKVSAHATIITFESEKEVVMELDFER